MTDQSNTGQQGPVPEITVHEAWRRLSVPQGGDRAFHAPALLIDVREAWEYANGHAAGALSLPLSELEARAAEVPRDSDVLLICQVGQRSMVAARYLRQRGVPRVTNVDGGTDAWQAARLPLER